ncbi:FkbM family methyltransferase [bacterium]|nr:FkbM family methyltransferase [bacterium]
MNAIENLALNLSLIPRTYADVRNPGMLLKDYLGLVGEDYCVELRDGTKLQLRHGTTDKGIIKEVFLLDHYRFALERLKPGNVVIDVGAQIGVFSVYVARRGPHNLSVHSFEPMSANYAMLQRNLALNNLQRVTAHNAAVTATAGSFKLYLSADNTGMHSLYGSGVQFEEVEGRAFNTLYESLGVNQCDLLKLDCEGAEHEILMTATDEALQKTAAIVMEYHDENQLPDILQRLKASGFTTKLPHNGAPMVQAWRLK